MSPQRTCIGCRNTAAPEAMLRLVLDGGVVVPDPGGRLSGRGAWIHPTLECLQLAERRRAWGRAWRTGAALDTSAVRDAVARRV